MYTFSHGKPNEKALSWKNSSQNRNFSLVFSFFLFFFEFVFFLFFDQLKTMKNLRETSDDLEIVDLKHLQATQDEMMKKLAIMDDDVVAAGGELSENSSAAATPKVQKKLEIGRDGSSRKQRWKNWGWKHIPAKSSSIEEEPSALLESPKRSHSSKSSTPNQSPKHKYKVSSNEAIANGDESSTPFRRRKQKPENSKGELRSSAGARLIQMFDNKDGTEKFDSDCDEFYALLPENGRPASIHIIQTLSHREEL